MNMKSGKVAAIAALLLAQPYAWAAESVEEARDALQTKEDDVTEEKNLEEVFQAAENSTHCCPVDRCL